MGRGAVGRGAVAGAAVGTTRPPDNPTAARHAARADEVQQVPNPTPNRNPNSNPNPKPNQVQQVLARYMLELQPPASAGDKADGGSLMDQVMQERAALHGMR